MTTNQIIVIAAIVAIVVVLTTYGVRRSRGVERKPVPRRDPDA